MVNFPPAIPVGSAAPVTAKPSTRRVVQSIATSKRESVVYDRRRRSDRRGRRGGPQLMDRRCGADRRRPLIDLSI